MLESMYQRLEQNKENKCLLKKHFTPEIMVPIVDKITPTYESNLGNCIFPGMSFVDPVIGLNAPDPEVYSVMAPLYHVIIKDYHNLNPKADICHPPTFFGSPADLMNRMSSTSTMGEPSSTSMDSVDCSMDPSGSYVQATRIRVSRSIEGYGFANIISPESRKEVENKLKEALCLLTGDLSGDYFSVSDMSSDMKQRLAERNLLLDDCVGSNELDVKYRFKDWPESRGSYVSHDLSFVAWVNGEDHLRIITTGCKADLEAPYRLIIQIITELDKKLKFVKDEHLGYLTYCPSNIGTGLHASVHISLPHFGKSDHLTVLCDKLNLTVEKLNQSPRELEVQDKENELYIVTTKRAVGINEYNIMQDLIYGVQKLIEFDKTIDEGKDISVSDPTKTTKCVLS